MKRLFMLLVFLMLPAMGFAGITFEKTYGDTANEYVFSLIPLPKSMYLLVGRTNSFGGVGNDGYLVKIDGHGTMLWQKNIDFGAYESFRRGLFLPDGSVLLVGTTQSAENEPADLLLVKVDLDGNVLWHKTYGGSGKDVGWDIKAANEKGFYYIAGYTNSFGAGGTDAWLLKIDANGDTAWTKTYGSDGDQSARICAVNGENIILIGNNRSLSTPQMYMLNVNDNGGWQRIFSTQGWTEGYSVCTVDTVAVFAGYGFWGSTLRHDMLVVMLGLVSGDTVMVVHSQIPKDDYAFGINTTQDGGFIVVGKGDAYQNDENFKGVIWKLTRTGETDWMRFWGGDQRNELWDVIQTDDHGYLAVGFTNSFGNGGMDAYVVKTDSLGQVTSLGSEPAHLPQTVSLEQNYPNPFNPVTTIRYSIPQTEKVELAVFDMLGRKVLQVVNAVQTAGSHSVRIRADHLPSGIYLYQLKAGNQRRVRKMMVLK